MNLFVGTVIVALCASIVLRARRRKVHQDHGRRPTSTSWFI